MNTSAPSMVESSPPPTARELLRAALSAHWLAAAVTAATVMAAVAVGAHYETRVYRTTATLELDPGGNAATDGGPALRQVSYQYLQTQAYIFRSRRVARSVVEQLGLHRDASFLRNVPPSAAPPAEEVSEDQAAEVLRDRLTVEPLRDTRLVAVHFDDPSPERAQRVLAALIQRFIALDLDQEDGPIGPTVDPLAPLQTELETSENALHDFKVQKNLSALEVDEQVSLLREEIRQISTSLTTVKLKKQELTARRDQLASLVVDDPSKMPASELLADPALPGLRQRYDDAVRARDREMADGSKPKTHPDVQKAEEAVAAAKSAVLAEVRNVRRAADSELAINTKQETGLGALLADAERRAGELSEVELEYGRLKRAREHSDKLYALVSERTSAAGLQRLLHGRLVHVVDPPVLPVEPARPRLIWTVLVATIAGALAGLAMALGLFLRARLARAATRALATPSTPKVARAERPLRV